MSAPEETIDLEEAGCRLLLVSPPHLEPQAFAEPLEQALEAGTPPAFVLRLDGDEQAWSAAAEALASLCRARNVAFLAAGEAERALALGADGIEVEGGARAVEAARQALGPRRIVGALCRTRHAAMVAGEAGADYVHLDAPAPEPLLDLVRWWGELFVLPCAAPLRALSGLAPLVAAGADFLAVREVIWQHPEGAARAVMLLEAAIQEARGASPREAG